MSQKAAVIGAGPMGLAVAYELAKQGIDVTVFERDERIGGMSASFDFDGVSIERYYHFVCAPDHSLFEYLREFGIEGSLRWADTRMGFFCHSALYEWGTPNALLKFPYLTAIEKARYAFMALAAKHTGNWAKYDQLSSVEWLTRLLGRRAYEIVWEPLFRNKFQEYANSLSAAWLIARIKRVARSRKNVFVERLGYLEGGSHVLLQAIAKRLRELNVEIVLNANVTAIDVTSNGDEKKIDSVTVSGATRKFDKIISTIPMPCLGHLLPGLPADELAKIQAIKNVGVVCVVLKLKSQFSPYFWMNINDDRIDLSGIIEYTNLNPCSEETILYAPYYMAHSSPKYQWDNSEFISQTISYLQVINSGFDPDQVVAATAHRYDYAQPVCTPGFFNSLPSKKSAVKGLFMADTSHYYPEDRSISESMRVGQELARLAASSK